jgi:phosphoribosyl 1,2-cyclic phosphodiesterase
MPGKRAESLRVVVLGSGSSGNATAITDGTTTVLVDCGFSARETARRLAACGLDAGSVAALFVTHEHSDHIRGVEVFARRHGVPVFATPGTRGAAGLDRVVADVRSLAPGDDVAVGSLRVRAFRTSHDAAQPAGYRISACDGQAAGLATDTGVLTPEAAEALSGCTIIALESNHDVEMLETGPYPYFLKNRIRSEHGHLANAQAADALSRLAHDHLRHVIAMHRSRQNNTRELALATIERRIAELGLTTSVTAADQSAPCWAGAPHSTLFDAQD